MGFSLYADRAYHQPGFGGLDAGRRGPDAVARSVERPALLEPGRRRAAVLLERADECDGRLADTGDDQILPRLGDLADGRPEDVETNGRLPKLPGELEVRAVVTLTTAVK